MSFNLATRINNLQVQINNIEDKGLTNPLGADMDVAGYEVLHVKQMTGDTTNGLTLSTASSAGIILDTDLHSTHEITCSTLNYTTLNPPVSGGTQTFSQILASSGDGGGNDITNTSSITTGTLNYTTLNPPIRYNNITYTLVGGHTVEPSPGNINMFNDNPNSGFISMQSLLSPSMSCYARLGAGNNTMNIGFSNSTATTPTYGIYIFCNEGVIQNLTTGVTIPLPSLDLYLKLSIVGTIMKVFINNVEAPTLQSTVPNVEYYLNCNCYANTDTEIQAQNIFFEMNNVVQNLSDVLTVGNSAGNQDIIGVKDLTVTQLNYTSLNPPLPTAQTFSQILASSGNGGGNAITNTSSITTGTLNYTTLNPPLPTAQTFSQILASSGDGGGHAITNTSAITTGTLNYTSLNPPIESSSLFLTLLLNATYVNEVVTMPAGNPNIGFYTNNTLFNPSIQGTYTFSTISGANSMSIGYTTTPTAQFPVAYGILFYPKDGIITAIGTQATIPYTPSTISVNMQIAGKTLHIYVNGVLEPTLDQIIPSNNYHMIAFGYADVSCIASNLSFIQGTQLNLSEVLFIGNDGGNQNITGINNLTVSNLNYTTLNPPISGTTPSLSQVLTAGNSAGGSNITNVGVLTSTNSTTDVCVLTSNPTSEQFQLFGNYSSNKNNFAIQQYSAGAVKATPVQINDVDSISLNSASLRYNTNNYILDTNINVPSLVQAFSISAQQISFLQQLDTVFSMPIYPVSTVNFGIKSMTLEFSMLSLLLTSSSNFKEGTQILLYLAESQTDYNPAQGNVIVIIPGSTASYQYNQTYAKLWYTTANATPTNLNNLYLCIYFSIDNGIQACNITSSFLASTMVSTITSNPITWNS